jgi:hypothetical protein
VDGVLGNAYCHESRPMQQGEFLLQDTSTLQFTVFLQCTKVHIQECQMPTPESKTSGFKHYGVLSRTGALRLPMNFVQGIPSPKIESLGASRQFLCQTFCPKRSCRPGLANTGWCLFPTKQICILKVCLHVAAVLSCRANKMGAYIFQRARWHCCMLAW